MTQQRDLERILDQWFTDGPTASSDRVIYAVADRIERQPQRPTWRLLWRETHMNTILRTAAAIAAVAIVAFVGFNLLPGSSGGIGGSPATTRPSVSPSPSPSESPSSTVECEDNLPGCAGPLTAGTHQSNQFEPGFSYTTVGAPGEWLNVVDIPAIYKIDQGDPGDPYALLWSDASIPLQDASCSSTPDPTKGRKAADWIAYFTTHPGLVASAPVSVDVGGREMAQQVELALDPEWTATCPQHQGPYLSFLTQPLAGRTSEYGLGGNGRVLVTVVDIGRRTVVILSYGPLAPESFATSTQSVRALIASFRFRCTLNDGPCGAP